MIKYQTNEMLIRIISNIADESRYSAIDNMYSKFSLEVGGDGGIISYGKNSLYSMGAIPGTVFARWAG